jgi:hypothetical protein
LNHQISLAVAKAVTLSFVVYVQFEVVMDKLLF